MISARNIWVHTILCLLTFGLFSLYWQWVTARDMSKLGRLDANAGVVGVLQFIPYLSFYVDWKWAKGAAETLQYRWNQKFLFWLAVFNIVAFIPLIILQRELNQRARAQANS